MTRVQKRFAIVARVSSKTQEDGQSIKVQLKKGMEFVKRMGGKVVKTYEFTESATKPLAERKKLQEILRDAHSNEWDALWVFDQSRLLRAPDALMAIESAVRVAGIQIYSDRGPIDLVTPEGELQAGNQSNMDRFFARKLAQRTRDSRHELLLSGQHAFGRWPWGLKWNKDSTKWEVIPEKKILIKRACELYVEHDLSLAEVAKKVGMSKSSLTKAFQSAGMTQWPRKLNTPDGMHEFVLTKPALLNSREVWAIRSRKERNSTIRPGMQRSRWLLQGLARCWDCGGNLSGMPGKKSKLGKNYPVYRHLLSKRGKECLHHVPADLLEDDVVYACAEIIRDDKLLQKAIETGVAGATKGLRNALARSQEIDAALITKKRRLQRAKSELLELDGAATACIELRDEIRQVSLAIEELSDERDALRDQISIQQSHQNDAKKITAQLRRIIGLRSVAAIRTLTREQKRTLVVLMVGRENKKSSNGIFVKMRRGRRIDRPYWPWELRGTLAVAAGVSSGIEELAAPPDIKRQDRTQSAAIMRLAELVRSLDPLRHKSGRLYSLGG